MLLTSCFKLASGIGHLTPYMKQLLTLSIGKASAITSIKSVENVSAPFGITIMFFTFLCTIVIIASFASTTAFVGPTINTKKFGKSSVNTREYTTKLDLFLAPQIGFAAACAGAVFAYVYSNIDSIKEVSNLKLMCGSDTQFITDFPILCMHISSQTQKIATDKAVSEQAASLKSVEAGQKAALEKVKAQQAANIARSKQIAADAKQRADDIGREAAKKR